MCIGFFAGGLIGAKFAFTIPDIMLKRIFGVALMLVSAKTIFGK